jgi:hypothetical protein
MNDLMKRFVVKGADGSETDVELFTGELAEQDAQFFANKNGGDIVAEIYREQTPDKVERTEKVEPRSDVPEPVGYRNALKTKAAPFSNDSEPALAPHERHFGEQLPGGTEVVDPALVQAKQKEQEILDPPRAVEEG